LGEQGETLSLSDPNLSGQTETTTYYLTTSRLKDVVGHLNTVNPAFRQRCEGATQGNQWRS